MSLLELLDTKRVEREAVADERAEGDTEAELVP